MAFKVVVRDRDKKIIAVIATVIIVLSLVFAAVAATLNKGDTTAQGVFDYQSVEPLPTNSRELTEVPEPPVSATDDEDDKHIGVDMRGKEIDEAPDTSKDARQVSNLGTRFKVPSVGLDVPLGAMNETGGVINPSGYTSAYSLRNRGVPYYKTNEGTSYIVMHALDGNGVAPGNFLIDSSTKKVKVHKGDVIQVGSKDFLVSDTIRAGKDLIAKDANIWSNKKWRLVIITCFPDSNDNQVIIADRWR